MGEFYALASAVVWAGAVIFFRRSGESTTPLALNLFRVTVSSALFLVTLAVVGQPLVRPAPAGDYLLLAASGIIAIALSDTLFHMGLNRVGAGINAIVDTTYSPFTAFFAFVLLGEGMGPWQLVGMVLIVGAVLLAARVEPPPGTTRRTLVSGVLLAAAAMATLGFGIVIVKPVLTGHDVLWATAMRQFASLAVLAPAALVSPRRRELWRVFRPQRSWRFTVPGTVLGSYLALTLWIAGMKHTNVGAAAALNQSSTILILIFASVFLKERFTRRKGTAAVLALAGICCVILPS